MLAGCEEQAVGDVLVSVLDGDDLQARAGRQGLRAQHRIEPVPRQPDGARRQPRFCTVAFGENPQPVDRVTAELHAKPRKVFQGVPAHEPAAQRITDFALAVEDKRSGPALREDDCSR